MKNKRIERNKIYCLIFFLFLLGIPHAFGAVTGQLVEYHDGSTTLEGYIAYDDAIEARRPAVMVVHEWNGLNDYAKMRADRLAKLGYVGFAIDLYGKDVRPQTHEEAGKISGAFQADRAFMRRRAKAAYDFLLKQTYVDPNQVAAIGYCFGGSTVLEMARAGWPLAGVATFHGFLATPMPAKKGDIKARIIVFHGDEDPFVTNDQVEAFRKEMREAEADWQLVILSGAVHRFTVPASGNDKSKGAAYNEKADKASWRGLTSFLHQIFE